MNHGIWKLCVIRMILHHAKSLAQRIHYSIKQVPVLPHNNKVVFEMIDAERTGLGTRTDINRRLAALARETLQPPKIQSKLCLTSKGNLDPVRV